MNFQDPAIFQYFYLLGVLITIMCQHNSYFYNRRRQRGGTRKQKQIQVQIGHRPDPRQTHHPTRPRNLTVINTVHTPDRSKHPVSPPPPYTKDRKHPAPKLEIRSIVINFQSILPKRAEFWHILSTMKPDIIIGCETWLKPDVNNAEIIPPELEYNVFRKDRHDGYV